jgi:hypothetical protein
MEKVILAYLKYWTLANGLAENGLHQHGAAMKIQHELYRDFMDKFRIMKVSHIN